jgi:hypothetical protein
MRALKVFLTALVAVIAMVAGVFLAAVAAITSLAIFSVRRLRRGQNTASRPPYPIPAARRHKMPADENVIDVTAVEIPADPMGPR